MREEIDQIILHAIKKYGTKCIPNDIRFLEKYDLKELYIKSCTVVTEYYTSEAMKHLNEKYVQLMNEEISITADKYIKYDTYPLLNEYLETKGSKYVFQLLNCMEEYYDILIKNNIYAKH